VVAVSVGIVSRNFPEIGKFTGKISSYRACIGTPSYITYRIYYTFNLHFSSEANLTGNYQGKQINITTTMRRRDIPQVIEVSKLQRTFWSVGLAPFACGWPDRRTS
jgi:hypothetical protein